MNESVIEQDLERRMLRRLAFVYGDAVAPDILAQLEALIRRYAGRIAPRRAGWSQADALLITYADSLLGDPPPLQTLHAFLRERVGSLISFVHLLPFFPYSSDDGFAVEDFRAVRGGLGTWDDVEALAGDYRLVFDAVINHVSASGTYMNGYRAGDERYRDFFIALDPDTDTSSVLRTRNLPLLHDYDTPAGVRWLWTTFSRDQVDLNFANPAVLIEILDVLLFYAARGASMVRLDAIPYLWKELGTSCAGLPRTHELIKLFRDVYDAAAAHMLLLTETNVPHHENTTYFGDRGDEAQMIYNFTLAPLILWSLVSGDATALSTWASGLEWIGERATYLNITATHDGIGMRPTEGILPEGDRRRLVELARDHGGDVTGKRNADGSVSPYELNLNYFDAVNDPRADEREDLRIKRFVVSQAIPMAMMGLPGLYLHSLLGSRNDDEGVRRTGRARSINRQQLNAVALGRELDRPASRRARVFAAMAHLLRTRARLAALHPDARQTIVDCGPGVFAVRRTAEGTGETLLALHNVSGCDERVSLPATGPWEDALTGKTFAGGDLTLGAYDVHWWCGNAG